MNDTWHASPTVAVILAAGQGVRLGNRSCQTPKGLLEIGGESLLERSVRQLLATGIRHVLVGTGHLAAHYVEHFADAPTVTCVYNQEYSTMGNAQTLYCMRDHVEGQDFLLLESDLLYERRALTELCTHVDPDVILASSLTESSDEVFIETDACGRLVNMSKNRGALSSVAGELVGISRISAKLFSRLCRIWEGARGAEPTMSYEGLLVRAGHATAISVHVCDCLVWCEIDDEQHWRRANEYIYPRLPPHESGRPALIRNPAMAPTRSSRHT